MIYLDTSALVKLVFEENESAALSAWVNERGDQPKISSDLSTIELLRTCWRVDEDSVGTAQLLLGGIDRLPIDRSIVERSSTVTPRHLRSLDAIHLASALSVKASLTAFVAYDERLCSAARESGIVVASPS